MKWREKHNFTLTEKCFFLGGSQTIPVEWMNACKGVNDVTNTYTLMMMEKSWILKASLFSVLIGIGCLENYNIILESCFFCTIKLKTYFFPEWKQQSIHHTWQAKRQTALFTDLGALAIYVVLYFMFIQNVNNFVYFIIFSLWTSRSLWALYQHV